MIGSGGFGGVGDRVGARFEDTPEAVCWGGAGSCGFVGASGSTVGGDCEDLDLQGNHPIFPSIGEWWIPKRQWLGYVPRFVMVNSHIFKQVVS